MSSVQHSKKSAQASGIPGTLQAIKADERADEMHMAKAILAEKPKIEEKETVQGSRLLVQLHLKAMQEKQDRLLYLVREMKGNKFRTSETFDMLVRWAVDCAEDAGSFYSLCESLGVNSDKLHAEESV